MGSSPSSAQKLRVCGLNTYSQLAVNSNQTFKNDIPFVCPPLGVNIDISTLNSFSTFRGHSVWVNKNGEVYGIGDNRQRLLGIPDRRIFKEAVRIEIPGNTEKVVSAVCGSSYTLFLTENGNLILTQDFLGDEPSDYIKTFKFDSKMVQLFGGSRIQGAIDENGDFVILVDNKFNVIDPIKVHLPEKTVQLACCCNFVCALTESGQVYGNYRFNRYIKTWDIFNNKNRNFVEAKKLSGIKVTSIVGTSHHCIAVSDDGRAFAIEDEVCCHSTGLNISLNSNDFTEISSLNQHKIEFAAAGENTSFFVTDTGKVLVCGENQYGQLFTTTQTMMESIQKNDGKSITNENYKDNTVIIKLKSNESEINSINDVKYLVPGDGITLALINSNPPEYMPNLNKLLFNNILEAKNVEQNLEIDKKTEKEEENNDFSEVLRSLKHHSSRKRKSLIKRTYTKEEKKELKRKFKQADSDGNKSLDIDEFTNFISTELNINRNLSPLIFEICDKDDNGSISFKEFIFFTELHSEFENEEVLFKALFTKLDKDNDGFLKREQLIRFIKATKLLFEVQLPIKITPENITNFLIQTYDSNGDGKLSYDEMLTFFKEYFIV
ncbi:hypothetical protein TRFO_09455 [Tritrichomonas foetus]|uniref:EF-hand domain-containing protein n=1 Tax=Tritrichomonas foetus TaxID=1144522 RepID=A0A1J4JFK4_9EUKA|nr:hypothetical protein TRFO_09455 [Tritrichomonas foetus]|eukprot:OHS97449.1 hypothetical protein TRFO_09455 [Tritrichomonas foetus]